MIEAEQVEQGGVEIVNVDLVLDDVETEVVRLAEGYARPDSTAGEPNREALGVVVALSFRHVSLDPTRPWAARLLDDASPRAQSFVTAWAALRAHPWRGTGPGTSPGVVDGLPFDAHCTPLNVGATLGLPALAGFALVPFALWRARARPTDRATWGMLAGLALDGLAQDVEDFRHLWIAFGLADAGRANLKPR